MAKVLAVVATMLIKGLSGASSAAAQESSNLHQATVHTLKRLRADTPTWASTEHPLSFILSRFENLKEEKTDMFQYKQK